MTKFRLIGFLPTLREAIERGEKTQTRRLMEGWLKGCLLAGEGHTLEAEPGRLLAAKYGPPGTVLVVKQPWAVARMYDDVGIGGISPACGRYAVTNKPIPREVYYQGFNDYTVGKKRQDRFMPYWAGRLFLVVESVKYEPVTWISEEDAIAEGVERLGRGNGLGYFSVQGSHGLFRDSEAKGAFGMLWDSLHEEEGTRFADSPMVWAYKFRAVAVGSEEWRGYRKELLEAAVAKYEKSQGRALARASVV